MADERIKAALEAVLQREHSPVMLVCDTGVNVTGVVVACLRRLQRWVLSSVLEEFRSYATGGSPGVEFEHAIELFDTDLVTLPAALPDWFDQSVPAPLVDADADANPVR